ncbi:MAG TPA: helix-turn-helix transcriptional regulator [Dehalococcoidia bacterium]
MVVADLQQRTRSEIVRLCQAGLSVEELSRRVLACLRAAVPFDAWCWSTADPATLLITSSLGEGIPGELARRFFEIEYGEPDVQKLASLVTRRPPVGTLQEATGGTLSLSTRWRELFGPCGMGDELRAALVEDGACWGYLSLHRRRDAPPFAPREVAYVAALLGHLAHGLRTSLLLGGGAADGAAPAVILLAADLTVLAVTPAAERWLAEAVEGDRISDGALPNAVYAVASSLRAAGPGGPEAAPRARIRLRNGRWLTAHALRLAGRTDGQIAVVLEPAQPGDLAPLALEAYGLTARESQVVGLVMQGRSTAEIAEALVVSPLTVQQHLKSVFEKVGVRSRRELVARIFAQQYWPRIEAGVPPGADGWFAEGSRQERGGA